MTMKFAWYEANGAGPWALSGIQDTGDPNGYGVLADVRGLDMPPFVLVTDEVPLQPGAQLRAVKTQPRVVDLPIYVRATSPTNLDLLIRGMRRAMNPTRGDGRLMITPADGNPRYLNCRYQSGWQGDIGSANYGVTWQDILVSLYACDPYFYAESPIVKEFRPGQSTTTFLSTTTVPVDKFLPLQITGSTVLGVEPITNLGDVAAWPVWTITGPATVIHLTNFPPGGGSKDIEVVPNPALLAGQVLKIDTRPGYKTVVGPGGVNMFGDMNANSIIWSLEPGTNTVTVSATNPGGSTLVHMEYTPAYLGL